MVKCINGNRLALSNAVCGQREKGEECIPHPLFCVSAGIIELTGEPLGSAGMIGVSKAVASGE
jgi:hypothetical protein